MNARVRRVGRWALGWPVRTAAVGCVLTVLLGHFASAGRAEARAEMLEVGSGMLRLPEAARPAGDVLRFNGAELEVTRSKSARAVADVLAAAEAACIDPASPDGAVPGTAFRGGDDQHGFLACLDPAADPERRGLLERFLPTLGSLPLPLSYTYAERRGDATHTVGFRSARPIDLRQMFPKGADAPGADPAGLPRPATSRRALSLRVDGEPYEAAIYLDGELGLDQLVTHYQGTLGGAGWSVVAPWRVEEGPGPRQASVVIERAGVLALLVIARDSEEATSTAFVSMEGNREQ